MSAEREDRSAVADVLELFTAIGRDLGDPSAAEVFDRLTRVAVKRVPGTQQAGVTRGRHGRFETVAATSPTVEQIDRIQYDLRSGPCVDAVLTDHVFCTGNLARDERWREFGRRAHAATGVQSMLAFRLFVEDDGALVAGLNVYSDQPAAFDVLSRDIGMLVATHGALAVRAAGARSKILNLELALASSRDIGVAIGILMSAHKITRDQAFDLLRIASQNSHVKLADVAVEVGDLGAMPDLGYLRDLRARRRPAG